jgi:SSS family transporter
MTPTDTLAIIFYAVFMIAIGVIYTKKNKNSSDFFRAGGSLTWWLVGASAFVTLFSAWTFVGCAGRVYRAGSSTSLIFLFNAVALVLTFFLAPRFRRLRVISWVEAVRLRFGKNSEKFFTLFTSAVALLGGGMALYTIAVFLSPVFGLSTTPLIIGVAFLITAMSALGGSLAVMASDFIQSLFITAVSIVVAVLVLRLPEVGGLAGLVAQSPDHIFDWTAVMRPEVLGLWGAALLINQTAVANSLHGGASRYLAVRNERHARLAVLFPFVGMVLMPVLAFIPPIAATFIMPDIELRFPLLNNPSEASYVAMALEALPPGMTGMLVCAIFAATLTTLNSNLSIVSSVVTRNVYLVLFRPSSSETELLLAGRVITVLMGLIMMSIGLYFQTLKDFPLFEITLALAGLIGMPMIVPLVLAVFIRRTPDWSGWGTVVLGTLVSASFWFSVPAENIANLSFWETPLSPGETGDVRFAITLILSSVACVIFFLFSMCFDRAQEPAERAVFFTRMQTPIEENEISGDSVGAQAKLIGILGLVYGIGVGTFSVFAATWNDRLPFIAAGSIVVLVCGWLYFTGRREIQIREPLA